MPNDVAETATSTRWSGAQPRISVVVSTYRRTHYLPGLFVALEAQDLPPAEFEVVIVDNGSNDDTWDTLCQRVASTPLAVCALRIEHNEGPAPGRNAAIAHARAPLFAFTDDDCLPRPAWLREMLQAFADGARVVQGRTEAETDRVRGTWDHTVIIRSPTSLFETCNVGYHREDVAAAGGFHPLPTYRFGGKPFGGEDTVLGWKVLRATGRDVTFAPEAVVEHRIEPRTYRKWLKMRNGTSLFPALVRAVPEMRNSLFLRVFLTSRSAAFDLAVIGVVAAAALRSVVPLLAVIPYLGKVAPRRRQSMRRWAARLIPTVVGDATAALSLLRGSIRHRSVVL